MSPEEIQQTIDLCTRNGTRSSMPGDLFPDAMLHVALFEIALQLAIMNERGGELAPELRRVTAKLPTVPPFPFPYCCSSSHADVRCLKEPGHEGPHQNGKDVWDHD